MQQNVQDVLVTENLITHEPSAVQRKRWGLLLIKSFISIALIFWILQKTDLREIIETIGSANIKILLLAYLMVFIGHFLSVLRWRVLLEAQGSKISVATLFYSYMVGLFFNNLLPSTIGGDAYRAYDTWKIGKTKEKAVAVIMVDRFLGLLALFLFSSIAIIFLDNLPEAFEFLYFWLALAGIGVGLVLCMFLFSKEQILYFFHYLPLSFFRFFPKKILETFEKIGKNFLRFISTKKMLFMALVLSVLLQINVVIHYYIITTALGLDLPFGSFFLVIPLSLFIMMIPISINGIGIREGIFAFFFVTLGATEADAVALAWIAYGFIIVQGILGGIIYSLRR